MFALEKTEAFCCSSYSSGRSKDVPYLHIKQTPVSLSESPASMVSRSLVQQISPSIPQCSGDPVMISAKAECSVSFLTCNSQMEFFMYCFSWSKPFSVSQDVYVEI
ncbi:hypothetical protein KP509_15G070500 [Ceratopteris richardii]|nr:hypothetical protein KP509_15G070500 [Ceratopteris richardii]